jgi:hypothetical protein
MAKLSGAQRQSLPDAVFGLPGSRQQPAPARSSTKARATQPVGAKAGHVLAKGKKG